MGSMRLSKGNRQAVPDREREVVIGIDVGKREMSYRAFWLEDTSSLRTAKQDAAGFRQLREFVGALREEGYEPWLAYEPTGPYSTCLREWLVSEAWRVVQVNPYQVRQAKELRDNNPTKSDWKDPGVIADLVWQGCYREVRPVGGVYAELRAASGEWASLTKKHTGLGNEFQGLLEVWFPELAEQFRDRVAQSVRALVRRYSGVEAIAQAGPKRLTQLLHRVSHGRTTPRAQAIWEAARASVAPPGGQGARHRHLCCLLDSLQSVEARQAQLRGEMEALLEELPEARFLLSVPGVSTVSVAGLLGECGDLGAYACYESLEKQVGLNLYEISSGKHRGQRHISKRGRSLARHLLCQIALAQMRAGGLYYDFTEEQRAKGKKGREIQVAVARKLLRLLYALARTRACFDRQRFVSGKGTGDGLPVQSGTLPRAA